MTLSNENTFVDISITSYKANEFNLTEWLVKQEERFVNEGWDTTFEEYRNTRRNVVCLWPERQLEQITIPDQLIFLLESHRRPT